MRFLAARGIACPVVTGGGTGTAEFDIESGVYTEIQHEDGAGWLGEPILLVPGHCDPTVNLYDRYVVVRHGRVEGVWPIEARGLSQ